MNHNDLFSIDGHKLMYHPGRVAQWLDAGDDWDLLKDVYPLYLEVSPLGACNHRCSFCAVDYLGYKLIRLDADIMSHRLQEMGRLGVRSIMYAGEGEPLLHPKIVQLVCDTHSAGIDVAITTNGTFLKQRFLDACLDKITWIKISINAGDAEGYAKIHHTKPRDFHRVVMHMELATHLRAQRGLNCAIGAQCVLLPENANSVVALARICRNQGLDYLVVKPYSHHLSSITQTYKDLSYDAFQGLEDDLASEQRDGFKIIYRNKTMSHLAEDEAHRYSTCQATPFFWGYVMSDGAFYGCSAFLKDERFHYGNLMAQGFQDIWQGEKRQQAIAFVRNKLDIRNCRKSCRMDHVNRYLSAIKEEQIPHVNFI